MSTKKVSNHGVFFTKIPEGLPVINEHFKLVKREIDISSTNLENGEILTKNLYMSLDPYLRGKMRPKEVKSYTPAFNLDEVMVTECVGVVVKSNNDQWKEGELYLGFAGWEEYSRISSGAAKRGLLYKKHLKNASDNNIPLSYFLGVLGMPGFTAHYSLSNIGKPKEGETIFISAASGAVGQVVGQIAKSKGLKVVGSAGDENKINYLKNELKFDHAFNYKKDDVDKTLKETCPEGIDIYFDNVGGEILDITIKHLNTYGRIVVCGMISGYNTNKPYAIKNIMEILTKRLLMQGFIILDHYDHFEQFQNDMIKLLNDNKVKYKEHVVNGIDNAPQAFLDMFDGKNFGKLIVKIHDL